MKRISFHTFMSLTLLLINSAWANEVKINIVDYGIYKQEKNFETIPDNEAVSGYRSESETNDSVKLVKKTTNIPLIKGIMFGFRAKITGLNSENSETITIRCEHPNIKHPNGTSSSLYEFDTLIYKEKGIPDGGIMFIMSEDYEMVSGKWKFMVLQNGNLLAKKEFITSER